MVSTIGTALGPCGGPANSAPAPRPPRCASSVTDTRPASNADITIEAGLKACTTSGLTSPTYGSANTCSESVAMIATYCLPFLPV